MIDTPCRLHLADPDTGRCLMCGERRGAARTSSRTSSARPYIQQARAALEWFRQTAMTQRRAQSAADVLREFVLRTQEHGIPPGLEAAHADYRRAAAFMRVLAEQWRNEGPQSRGRVLVHTIRRLEAARDAAEGWEREGRG